MSIADVYLADLHGPDRDWDRESAAEFVDSVGEDPGSVREEEMLRYATRPVMGVVIRFAADQWPGANAADDARWAAMAALARRDVADMCGAGIAVEMSGRALGLLDWIDGRIGTWEGQDFGSLVRARVDDLLDARRSGLERGRMLRERRGEPPPPACSACWALRHPADHYFKEARVTATDDRLTQLLDPQITELARGYDRLSADHDAHDHAQLVAELRMLGPIGPGWSEPVTTTVLSTQTAGVPAGERLGLRLVANPHAPFNGTLISVRAGERWLVRADRLDDGTIVPRDGTRRLAA